MSTSGPRSITKIINSILLFPVCCAPLVTIVLSIIGTRTDNRLCTIWSVAIYPVISVIAMPNVILRAVSDNRFKEEFSEKKAFFDKYHTKIDDAGTARKVLLPDMNRTAVISSVSIAAVVFGMLFLAFNFYLNDGPDHVSDRLTILRFIRPDYKAEGGVFLITMLLLILGLPVIAHTIATNLHRLRLIKKQKYSCYKVYVESVDSKGKLHVRTTKGIDEKGYKHIKNLRKNTLDDYKCVGISEKEIKNKEVQLVLIPGFAYLLSQTS